MMNYVPSSYILDVTIKVIFSEMLFSGRKKEKTKRKLGLYKIRKVEQFRSQIFTIYLENDEMLSTN